MIALPIKLYNKCINILFNIEFNKDNIIIKPHNNHNNIFDIILFLFVFL